MSSKTKNVKLSKVTEKAMKESEALAEEMRNYPIDPIVQKINQQLTAAREASKKAPKPQVFVEDVSDEDSGSEIELTVSESDSESDELSESEEQSSVLSEPKEKIAKESKPKPTFEGCFNEIDALNKEELKLNLEITELNKILDSKEKQVKALIRQRNKIFNLLPKAYEDGCTRARKEKKKRTNASRSGILKESAVPAVLVKFLGLKEGTLLSRPKVFSLLNNKFKELELKKGQDTFLDKKTAKLFGLEEGHKIEFKMCQTFLANLYNAEKAKSNEVSL